MKIISTPDRIVRWRAGLSKGVSVGFVPTMGALHDGHFSLIRRSQGENDRTVVSIFVNPIQFGPHEDYQRYPRPWVKDVQNLKKMGVDVLFSPLTRAMYGAQHDARISVRGLNSVLCGSPELRGPSHFDGVATVVAMLFNLVQPTRAYFGLKDYQQVRVIEQMKSDLHFLVQIVRCPTIREPDGLAKSSRNAYLNPKERNLASQLFAALQLGRKLLTFNRKMTPEKLEKQVTHQLTSIPNSRVEYVQLVDPMTLQRQKTVRRPVLIAAALKIGKTRLIDNILVK